MLLHFRTMRAAEAHRRLRSSSQGRRIRGITASPCNAGTPIDMTNRSHIAACFAPDLHVRGAGMANALIVDRQSSTRAAVRGGCAAT
jgi:hypothetical protein